MLLPLVTDTTVFQFKVSSTYGGVSLKVDLFQSFAQA